MIVTLESVTDHTTLTFVNIICDCGHRMQIKIPKYEPLRVGNQCSRCLSLLEMDFLVDIIKGRWDD